MGPPSSGMPCWPTSDTAGVKVISGGSGSENSERCWARTHDGAKLAESIKDIKGRKMRRDSFFL